MAILEKYQYSTSVTEVEYSLFSIRPLSPSITGCMETHVRPCGEGYDKLNNMNDTDGNQCVLQVDTTRPDLKNLIGHHLGHNNWQSVK